MRFKLSVLAIGPSNLDALSFNILETSIEFHFQNLVATLQLAFQTACLAELSIYIECYVNKQLLAYWWHIGLTTFGI